MNGIKYIYYMAAIAYIATIYGCGDCILESTAFPCRIREATVTRFDPRLILQPDSSLVPVPTYSIHTFTFPNDNTSSGLLSNDTRYDQNSYTDQFIVIDEGTFEVAGFVYTAKLVSFQPPNSLTVGDMMVIGLSLDSVPSVAYLRFRGSLARFPNDFYSEDAFKFCDEYLKDYRDQVDEDYSRIAGRASLYGGSLPNAARTDYTEDNIIVTDEFGYDVSALRKQDIPTDLRNRLLNNQSAFSVDLKVMPGEVYYYKAINGKEFAVIIADIREGTFEPFLKRVTLKFSELKGQTVGQCPGS